MPWKEASVMEQRLRFVVEVEQGERSKSALCEAYGISRPTGDKWLARYAVQGVEGLESQSRARHHQPQKMADEVAKRILALRRKHPRWGPAKLRVHLQRVAPELSCPAASTIGELLRAQGLVIPRRRHPRATPTQRPLREMDAPNSVWCADFKGWFRTGDGTRCDPLTIMDGHSRYLLRCQGVSKTDFEHVKALFEATFYTYGLPLVLRTDNGPPFASTGLLGLSRLSIWWSKLGIVHERIEPGKPQQNGRHERMHKTLKEATACPPKATPRAQQRAFDAFCEEYNELRPHQALGYLTPGAVYAPSARIYTGKVEEVTYPSWMDVRTVEKGGQIKWHGRRLFVSETFWGEPIGVEDLDTGHLRLWYAEQALGSVELGGGNLTLLKL
jgi:transposase InsO family protein